MSELFCRLCAKSEQSSEIIDFSTDIEIRNEIIQNISLFPLHGVDFTDKTLPEAVCTTCREILSLCCKFLSKIRQSQMVLRHYKDNRCIDDASVRTEQSTLLQVKIEPSSDTDYKDSFGVHSQNEEVFNTKMETSHIGLGENDENPLKLDGFKIEVKEVKAEFMSSHGAVPSCTQSIQYGAVNQYVKDASHMYNITGNEYPSTNSLPPLRIIKKLLQTKHTNSGQRSRKATKKEFTCKICHKVFHNRFGFNEHKLIHTDRKRDFKCEECGKSYYKASSLKSHMDTTHRCEPQVCPICNKVFQNKIRLKRHAKLHSGIKYECDMCHRQFTTKRLITGHIKTVHSDRTPHLCKFCGKGFKLKSTLKNHENVHKKEKPYSCKECGRKFTMWGNCDKHMKRKHGLRLAKTIITSLGRIPIDQKTGKPEYLNEESHSQLEPQKEFTCEGCGKNFKSKPMLSNHQKIAHNMFETQVCPICNIKLANWMNLKRHMKLHDNEKFECDHCHLVFNLKLNLRQHMLVHIDRYQFKCTYCEKRFKRNHHLKLHIRRMHV